MFADELSNELLDCAENLIARSDGAEVSEGAIRRSISTAYYAVYHRFCRECACMLVGDDEVEHPRRAWVEVYRSPGHNNVANRCKEIRDKNISKKPKAGGEQHFGFPECLVNFATLFVNLQEMREQADYNPRYPFALNVHTAEQSIEDAREAIKCLSNATTRDRKAVFDLDNF